MACYVLIAEILTLGVVFFLSSRHFMLVPAVIRHRVIQLGHSTRSFNWVIQQRKKESAMDDYQEELLEYQAFELDPLEPAEDATEL